jgi:hypothetical protein
MRKRQWNIEPGDIISYDIIPAAEDPPQFGVVMCIHLGVDGNVQRVFVRLLPWDKDDLARQINVSQVDCIWHLAN